MRYSLLHGVVLIPLVKEIKIYGFQKHKFPFLHSLQNCGSLKYNKFPKIVIYNKLKIGFLCLQNRHIQSLNNFKIHGIQTN